MRCFLFLLLERLEKLLGQFATVESHMQSVCGHEDPVVIWVVKGESGVSMNRVLVHMAMSFQENVAAM